jgi:putative tryptophan/tyrosine transport system substrate-binding protein
VCAAERVRRIGVLMGLAETDPEAKPRVTAFQQELQRLGWTEGRNARIDYRWGGGDASRIRAYAVELAGLRPDVIVANATPVIDAVRQETRTIPIVFVLASDPIGNGFVENLARPGGNLTGFSNFEFSMGGKWLETLKEIAPYLVKVAMLFNPETAPYAGNFIGPAQSAATKLGVNLALMSVRDSGELEHAIASLAGASDVGLIMLPDIFTSTHRDLLIAQVARSRVPAIYAYRYFVDDGGLVSYGVDTTDVFRQTASYVDRILRGANPGELPVQAPTKFELVISLKTAKALGVTVPPSLLARADKVIE